MDDGPWMAGGLKQQALASGSLKMNEERLGKPGRFCFSAISRRS